MGGEPVGCRMPITIDRSLREVASHLFRKRFGSTARRACVRWLPPERQETGLAPRRIGRSQEGNGQRLHVPRRGAKLPKPVRDQRLIAGREERGGEDQVRRSLMESREHDARGVADDELGANHVSDDGLHLRRLTRVGFDGHHEGAGYVRNIHTVSTTATATNVHK